ncbi:hypothetical protein [uncultured Dubosiella sp.]|nr:hypothetical protein [uncultured Dubosiella sp.]
MHVLVGTRRDPVELRLVCVAHEVVSAALLDKYRADPGREALQQIQ